MDLMAQYQGVHDARLRAIEALSQQIDDRADKLKRRWEELEEKHQACMELYGNKEADDNDTLKLNVGGSRVLCRRSILTLFPASNLAAMFSGRWDKKLLRDKNDFIFLDVNPVCFKLILEHLTLCAMASDNSPPFSPVDEENKPVVEALCAFYKIPMLPRKNWRKNYKKYVAEEKAAAVGNLLNELNTAFNQEEDVLDAMECEIVTRESRIIEEEDFVSHMSTGVTEDIVQLDVLNGDSLAVLCATLRQCPDSVFYHQFDKTTWRQNVHVSDSDAGMLVEQPSYAFGKVIDQLRLRSITPAGKKIPQVYIAPHKEKTFTTVVEYFFPGQEQFIYCDNFSSVILVSRYHKMLMFDWVIKAKSCDVKLSLLYQASRDGFTRADCNAKCDFKGTNVAIVKTSAGFVFGTYTNESWENGFRATGKHPPNLSVPFLFSFMNPSGNTPIKMPRNQNRYNQCLIADVLSCRAKSAISNLVNLYTFPSGLNSQVFLTDSNEVTIADMEVFSVQHCAQVDV